MVKPKGRPSDYNAGTAAAICARLADGESLRAICESEGMPDKSTVFRWLQAHEAFRDQYAQAREHQALLIASEIMEIADDGSNDWMEKHNKDGEFIGWMVNGEHVQRSRLRVDTRKWFLSKVLPKLYGDKLDITSDNQPIGVQIVRYTPTP